MRSSRRMGVCALALLASPLGLLAQPSVNMTPPDQGGGGVGVVKIDNPDDPRVQEFARRQKKRVEIEKELKKLRAEYFGSMRNTEIRQAGIHKLRQYTDPVTYQSLYKIFEKEKMDVRGAVADLLVDQRNDEADTVLTWGAVFDKDKEFRVAASERLNRRIAENNGKATARIQSVIAEGLKTGNNDELASAAKLAQTLNLVEAIPMLISAQLGGQGSTVGGGGGGGADTSLAWILVGSQTAFVSDLTPVVGDSAVAFDPTVSVITEGTYLRVIDAVVVTYRVDVHNALIGLSTHAWGQPTGQFGWDNPKWRAWYENDFKPYWAARQEEEKKKADRGRV